MQKPTVILVYGALRAGGIETLIIRVANYLATHGYQVYLLISSGPLTKLIDDRAKIIVYETLAELLRAASGESALSLQNSRVLLLSFDPISAARSLCVERVLRKGSDVRHLSGVFHPRAYFMTGEPWYRVCFNALLARAIGFESLFFINRECRDAHAHKWRVDLRTASVVFLPISDVENRWTPKQSGVVRIVSVGRLVEFKNYVVAIPNAVRRASYDGQGVTWDIYGEGPLRRVVLQEISRHNVGHSVVLRGELAYEKFADIISDYDLFVGMGTAALEAGMLGVPTICATDSSSDTCYGYLYELPFGNVGELQGAPPRLPIVDLICDYVNASVHTRALLGAKCRQASQRYGMDEFFSAVLRMPEAQDSKFRIALRWALAKVSYLDQTVLLNPLKKAVRQYRSN